MIGDSSGCYEEGLVGDFGGPRPRRKTGGPSIASDHGGLSRSLTLAELALGDFKLIARFILFSLTNEAKHAEQMPAPTTRPRPMWQPRAPERPLEVGAAATHQAGCA